MAMKAAKLSLAILASLVSINSYCADGQDSAINKSDFYQLNEGQCSSTVKYVDRVPFSKVQFNERTQYRTGSKAFLQMFRLAGVITQPDSILKGTYWSIETDSNMGQHADQFSSSYQEIEINKGIYFNKFYVMPGFVWHTESAGTQFDPYFQVGYNWTKTFTTGIRYRYNYWTYYTKDINKKWDRSAEHRIDLYVTKQFSDKFSIQYNPTFYQKVADTQYYYKNDQRHTLQHNFIFSYKATDSFTPYTELGYLDKTKNDKGEKVGEYQIRIGFRYDLN